MSSLPDQRKCVSLSHPFTDVRSAQFSEALFFLKSCTCFILNSTHSKLIHTSAGTHRVVSLTA